jgi:hypothetical protein
MNWRITYRNKGCKPCTLDIEAKNRSELFKILASRNISPITVTVVQDKKHPKNKTRFYLPILTLITILTFSIFYAVSNPDSRHEHVKKSKLKSKTVIHVQEKKEIIEKKVDPPVKTKLSNWDIRHLNESETNRLSTAEYEYWKMYHPNPPPDRDQPKIVRGRYKIFKNRSDNDIAFVLSTEPGTTIIGNRRLGIGFKERFLKSLETPIIIQETDTDYERNLKQTVIQARIELKDALDRGEDIGEMIDNARDELQKLGRYKMQLEKEATKLLHKKDTTSKDANDTIEAVNKMLDEKGIAPIELNSMSKLGIHFQRLITQEEKQ